MLALAFRRRLRCHKKAILVCLLFFLLVRATVDYLLLDKHQHSNNNNDTTRTPISSNILWIPLQADLTLADAVDGRHTSYNPSHKCSATSQVRIVIPPTNSQNSSSQQKWILQSVDRFGNLKTVGGDEYYITYHASVMTSNASAYDNLRPTAVAFITDQNDGTYELDFVSPPPITESEGTAAPAASYDGSSAILTVHFVYSCGIGSAYQPQKHGWNTGGATLVRHHANVSMIQPPPIRTFEPPGNNVDLNQFETVIFLGDSLVQQLAGYFDEAVNHRKRVVFKENVRRELRNSTAASWLQTLEDWHGDVLERASMKNATVALIVGSSAWDILTLDTNQGPFFQDHLDAVRYFVSNAQERYPDVMLFWKSPSALVSFGG
jgi:hypothetical protein